MFTTSIALSSPAPLRCCFSCVLAPHCWAAFDKQLYVYGSVAYLLSTIIFGIFIFWRILGYSILVQLLIFTDIILLTMLMHASGRHRQRCRYPVGGINGGGWLIDRRALRLGFCGYCQHSDTVGGSVRRPE